MTVPEKSIRSFSRVSLPMMSMWLVGSSRIRKLGRRRNIFESARRTFSPPDKSLTHLKTSSPESKNPPSVFRISPSLSSGNSARKSSRTLNSLFVAAMVWSKYPTRVFTPNRTSPESGGISPVIVLSNVDLPVPLLPITPIFCPLSTASDISPNGLSYPKTRSFTNSASLTLSYSGWKDEANVEVSKRRGVSTVPSLSISFSFDCAIAAFVAL